LNTGYRQREYMRLKYERETDESGDYITDENGNYVYKTDNEGDYIDNGDYQRMLNLFYEIEGREGYEFDGWFTNPNFNAETRVSENVQDDIITEFDVENNIILYAKWIDLEKGSDGLVFEKIEEPNPDYEPDGVEPEFLTYYIVIDYIDIADMGDYVTVEIEEEDYYRFTDRITGEEREIHNSLISFNDISEIQETELRIPSFHEGLPVKRIREGALNERGDGIERVSIPGNIEVIDEGVFASCYELNAFTLSEENESFVISKGVLYTADEKTLICYPANLVVDEYEYNNNIVPSTTHIISDELTRIAKGAFSNADIMYVAFEPGLLTDELVIGEEAFKGCLQLRGVGSLLTTERAIEGSEETETIYISDFTLPDRLVEIEAKAFYGCQYIIDIEATESSQLVYVGEDAFESTTWLNNLKEAETDTTYYVDNETLSNGIITIGYVVLGVTNTFSDDILFLDLNYTRSVADKAFYNNSIIKRVIIRNPNFEHIGKDAFRRIINLNRVDIYVSDPSTISIGSNAFGSSGYLNIYVPEGSVVDYENDQDWGRHSGQFSEIE
ncbi:MAG: leucine-rich repeat protein, partial [Bacillota bacterium]